MKLHKCVTPPSGIRYYRGAYDSQISSAGRPDHRNKENLSIQTLYLLDLLTVLKVVCQSESIII